MFSQYTFGGYMMEKDVFSLETAKGTYDPTHLEDFAVLGTLDMVDQQGRYLPLVLRDSVDPTTNEPMYFTTFTDQPDLINLLSSHSGRSLLMIHPVRKSKFNYTLPEGQPVQVIGAVTVLLEGTNDDPPALRLNSSNQFVVE